MLIDETVTYLEMTSPDQLRPARRPPAPVELQELDVPSAPLLRSTYKRVGRPYGWAELTWEACDEWLTRKEMRVWVARVGGEVAGLLALEAQGSGEVEIVVFALVPEFVGRGFGGHLLTATTQLAWELTSPDGESTRRVWLHTSSRDHPNALPNYERRGFRVHKIERRQREVPETP